MGQGLGDLLKKPNLTDADKEAIVAYGPVAFVPLRGLAVQSPKTYMELLVRVADRSHTASMLDLFGQALSRKGTLAESAGTLAGWMAEKGDPALSVPFCFRGLDSKEIPNPHPLWVALAVNPSPLAVPRLLQRMESPATSRDELAFLYGHVAANGDPDAIALLLKMRMKERTLGGDPTGPDSDGDGLPDVQDRNPFAAPRQLTEDERVMAAAFEAKMRFKPGQAWDMAIEFPGKPFELFGWAKSIVPVDRIKGRELSGKVVFTAVGRAKEIVTFDPDGLQAKVGLIVEESRSMRGSTLTLRKFEGEWFLVGESGTFGAVASLQFRTSYLLSGGEEVGGEGRLEGSCLP
ncbi:hypothetical protein EON81_01870 [bacterium]|nr:MAG: hypothetical protein EON81_01870 [bacterium]